MVAVGKAIQISSGSVNVPVVITNSTLSSASVSISDNTAILAPSGWDGTIIPPKTGSSSGDTPPAGFLIGSTVIDVGSPNVVLLFDKPVVVTLNGVTGSVGYKPAGTTTWTQITSTCGGTYGSPTISAVAFPGECSITNGTDTKILTYHLTTFGGLTPTVAGVVTAAGISGTHTIVYALTTGTLDPTNGIIPSNWTLSGTNVADLGSITGVVLSSGNTVATITVSGTVGAGGPNYVIEPLQAAFSAGFTTPTTGATSTITAAPVIVVSMGGGGLIVSGGNILSPLIVSIPGLPNTGSADSGCLPGDKFSMTTGNICASSVSIPGLPTTGTVVVPASGLPNTGTVYFRTLRVGTRGTDVTALQKALEQKGFFAVSSKIDGIFGPITRAAVIKYQTSIGLKGDGVFGPVTRAYLSTH